MGAFGWLAFNSTGYSRKQNRQGLGVMAGGKLTARPLGAASGITSPCTLSVTSTVWTVGSFTAIADLESDATMGPTPVVSDGNQTGSVTAASGSFDRYDLLYLTLDDATALEPVIQYVAGTVATTLPSTPSEAMPFAQITVPKSGTGSPTVTLIAPRAYAAGGIATALNSSFYPANPYLGQYVDDATLGLMRFNGAAWSSVNGDDGWTAFSLNSPTVVSGGVTPAARIRNGHLYVIGNVSPNTGTFAAGATITATHSSAFGPPGTSTSTGKILAGNGANVANGFFNGTGQIELVIGTVAMSVVNLDGLSGYLMVT